MKDVTMHSQNESGASTLSLFSAVIFILILPFSYYPKLIDGDSQLWTLMATLMFITFDRNARLLSQNDKTMVLLCVACLLCYILRSGLNEDFFRFTFKIVSFLSLWIAVKSLPSPLVAFGMKLVLLVWFVVGTWQMISIYFGWDINFAGRFVDNRSGVPSLTPEPSMFGMCSVLALLYLIKLKDSVSPIYYVITIANVFLSGAVLGFLALILIFLYFRPRSSIFLLCVLISMFLLIIFFLDLSFTTRLRELAQQGLDQSSLLRDYSINLRVGHIIYTLWIAFPEALFWQTSTAFGESYNNWAASTTQFLKTDSDFILTGAGDLIYRGGLFGFTLLILVYITAYRTARTRPFAKILVLTFFLLCQIGISSVFLIMLVGPSSDSKRV